jgi:hypothetical protein
MARTATKKSAARRPRKTAAKRTPAAPASTPQASSSSASSSAVTDLAGGLRTFLDAIESEVRAVSGLSEKIDTLVGQLNRVRNEQAERLLALDALRGSASDAGLTSFLDKLIRPRMPRVGEVVPDRLRK